MAQKTKVKELVGRGLHSYHTKALQQMDRIEKKNKEQNHKISILSNELDNDYLTKTEEGSVISLEHSKEGMVYLDELQGNTLVNYCTDGSKELTLNGDIDVEGTFVTTTEGVDNGLVDVMCEGNTLVNLLHPSMSSFDRDNTTGVGSGWFNPENIQLIKPSTVYTIISNITINTGSEVVINNNETSASCFTDTIRYSASEVGMKIVKVTSKSDLSNATCIIRPYTHRVGRVVGTIMVLEGDWTNKEIPAYFEGMKSVGQDNESGHKIEILSQNKNLYSYETMLKDVQYITKLSDTSIKVERTNPPSYSYYGRNISEHLINGKTYSLRADVSNIELGTYGIDIVRKSDNYREQTNVLNFVADTNKYIYTLKFYCNKNATAQTGLCSVTYTNIQLEYGNSSTSVVSPKLNKKEILINEPLRRLPNEVKDRIVKIGNKWFIERNCKELVVNTSTQGFSLQYWNGTYDTDNLYAFYLSNSEIFGTHPSGLKYQGARPIICDKFPYIEGATSSKTLGIWSGLSSAPPYIGFKLPKNIIDNCEGESVLEKGRNYLKSIGDMKFIVEYINPIYEPLEIEPTLNTYNDVTHISNNSLIPCNMKIKNSGYNAIIKPSTLYTVALDTDKSGTVGINLGGAKGTTTNNVATITTPATLTDDSLRLYGKGIKGSKVRLLEGDKTNWIPSYFDGMKSSFEDKLQDDGSYKMEILSNNKNLLNKELLFDNMKKIIISV